MRVEGLDVPFRFAIIRADGLENFAEVKGFHGAIAEAGDVAFHQRVAQAKIQWIHAESFAQLVEGAFHCEGRLRSAESPELSGLGAVAVDRAGPGAHRLPAVGTHARDHGVIGQVASR